jgi:membrane protein implicated in regulation of membrane protease activity
MELDAQYWWLIIGVALIILEIFTPSFFAASLAIGAFAAALAAFFGLGLAWQMGVFSVVGLASVFFVRPLMTKYLYAVDDVRTNADALIGRNGTILKAIENDIAYGRVAIDGDEWQCKSATNLPIAAGTKVKVTERESIILTVEPIL